MYQAGSTAQNSESIGDWIFDLKRWALAFQRISTTDAGT